MHLLANEVAQHIVLDQDKGAILVCNADFVLAEAKPGFSPRDKERLLQHSRVPGNGNIVLLELGTDLLVKSAAKALYFRRAMSMKLCHRSLHKPRNVWGFIPMQVCSPTDAIAQVPDSASKLVHLELLARVENVLGGVGPKK